jgi:hypothetical protein
MEEGGHYYTVYYTSLAVGFDKKRAYRHAVLSQMADEVGMLDAANLHKHECLRILGPKIDLRGNLRFIDAPWRIKVEKYHALVDKFAPDIFKTPEYQRNFTTQALSKEDANSLQFGLLLHRLGDTYAHTKIDNPYQMYTISGADYCSQNFSVKDNHGHGHHGSHPDYPVERPGIYFSYLENLYTVLSQKAQEPSSKKYLRNVTPKSASEVKFNFVMIFQKYGQWVKDEESKYQQEQDTMVSAGYEIRYSIERTLQVEMEKYRPEKQDNLTLSEFLRQHPELDDLKIDAAKIEEAIEKSTPQENAYTQNKFDPLKNLKFNPDTEMKNWIRRYR